MVGLDFFGTGRRENLKEVLASVSSKQAARFQLIEGDIRNLETCQTACRGVGRLLHHAAMASVPQSFADPVACNDHNVVGFLNGSGSKVQRVVYASSSSVDGDHPALPKTEEQTGRPLSPYAISKAIN